MKKRGPTEAIWKRHDGDPRRAIKKGKVTTRNMEQKTPKQAILKEKRNPEKGNFDEEKPKKKTPV